MCIFRHNIKILVDYQSYCKILSRLKYCPYDREARNLAVCKTFICVYKGFYKQQLNKTSNIILCFQATGTVTVNVDNENDNFPSCERSSGIVWVSENAGIFSRSIIKVTTFNGHYWLF